MATEVRLPDMGEGIEDVTINAWRFNAGDTVNEGDILLEVATDKVDTEVPSPVSGTLLKQNFGEGELADIDAVIAVIGEAGERVAEASAAPSAATPEPAAPASEPTQAAAPVASDANSDDVKASPVAKRVAADKNVSLSGVTGTGPGGQIMKDDVLAASSGSQVGEALPGDLADVPLMIVRRIAAENNISLDEVANGRPLSTLTKYDVLSAVASRDSGETVVVEPRFAPPSDVPLAGVPAEPAAPAQPSAPVQPAASTQPAAQPAAKPVPASPAPAQVGAGEELIKHTRMRQLVAKNTANSAFTSPHVTTMWDVDMSAVLAHRNANKGEFAKQGVRLTVTAYFIPAIIAGLKAVPAANAMWTDEGVVIKRYYNIGMATAIPMDSNGMGGLIVPVIKNAGDLNLLGVARAVNDLAVKARDGKLGASEIQGGTFTLSNYGTSGSTFQTPIIVQPQVGILGVGAIEKRPVVVSQGHPLEANRGDYLAFLPMTTLGFSYDHRVLDGATADAFCAAVKNTLENWT
ncbi:MAG: dihydrolipoamide acetyltransferase family protein [Chloroflexota bacterium]